MTQVQRAEQTLASLQAKREAADVHAVKLAEQCKQISFAAHTGDTDARKHLDHINRQIALQASETRTLDIAISEAEARVEVARQAEADAADRKAAKEARKIAGEVRVRFERADEHMAAAIKELNEASAAIDELHARGVTFPTAIQLRAHAVLSLSTYLMQLPRAWWDHIQQGMRYLPPGQRRSFSQIWGEMGQAIGRRSQPQMPAATDRAEAARAAAEFNGAGLSSAGPEGFESR
jgi:hypothetical protein